MTTHVDVLSMRDSDDDVGGAADGAASRSDSDDSLFTLPDALMGFGIDDDDDDVDGKDEARTPAWIAVGRQRRRGRRRYSDDDRTSGDDENDTIDALRRENARLRARMEDMERDFDATWADEMRATRRAVVARDAQWSRRVERYRKIANDTRAAHELDRATWSVERDALRLGKTTSSEASASNTKRLAALKSDVRALKAAHRELKSAAELTKRLIAPAVDAALDGVRRAL